MRKEFYNCLFINVVIGKAVRRERKKLQFSARVAVCNSLQHHKKTPEKNDFRGTGDAFGSGFNQAEAISFRRLS